MQLHDVNLLSPLVAKEGLLASLEVWRIELVLQTVNLPSRLQPHPFLPCWEGPSTKVLLAQKNISVHLNSSSGHSWISYLAFKVSVGASTHS